MTALPHLFRTGAVFVIVLMAGGCATAPSASLHSVRDEISQRGDLHADWPRTEKERIDRDQTIKMLLMSKLDPDSAVRIALLNNHDLQATFEDLGVSQADLVGAGLIHNPTLFASSRWPDRNPRGPDVEFSLTADLLDDLLIPLRKRLASYQVAAAEYRVSQAVLALASRVKIAMFTLEARQEFRDRMKAIADSSDAAADLAKRQYNAGNISRLDLVNQQVMAQDVQLELMKTEAQVLVDREEVNRLLQLSSDQVGWTAPGLLNGATEERWDSSRLETTAFAQRLDLAAAKEQVDLAEAGLSMRRKSRFSPVSLGIDTERNPDGSRVTGPQVEVGLPLFDQGQGDIARLDAEARRAKDSFQSLKAEISSSVRSAANAVAASRAVADFYTKTLLPQRKVVLRETLLNYNAMQRSTYELLHAKEAELIAERERIEAVRDYWISVVKLENAVGGRLPVTNP